MNDVNDVDASIISRRNNDGQGSALEIFDLGLRLLEESAERGVGVGGGGEGGETEKEQAAAPDIDNAAVNAAPAPAAAAAAAVAAVEPNYVWPVLNREDLLRDLFQDIDPWLTAGGARSILQENDDRSSNNALPAFFRPSDIARGHLDGWFHSDIGVGAVMVGGPGGGGLGLGMGYNMGYYGMRNNRYNDDDSLSVSSEEVSIIDYIGGDESDSDEALFATLLHDLRNNSPTATTVRGDDGDALRYPDGFGRRLGDAIQGNTHVTDMNLDLRNFSLEQTVACADLMLAYFRSTAVLERVEFQNWIPPLEDMNGNSAPNYAGMLLEAMMENPFVPSWNLRLFAPVPAPIFITFVKSTPALKELHVSVNQMSEAHRTATLKTVFGDNVSLERIGLHLFNKDDHLEAILPALAEHPLLKKVEIVGRGGYKLCRRHTRALGAFLPTTARLTHIQLTVPTLRQSYAKRLQRAMLKNGSVQSFIIAPTHDSTVSLWDNYANVARKVKAACLRNRLLPDLVTKSWETPPTAMVESGEGTGGTAAASTTTTTNDTNDDANNTSKADPAMFMQLLDSAMKAPRTGPNVVLRGLLTADSELG